ncbi:MAG: BMP family ABC transporter substrate-binding protein [Vallitalea sp.]|jgi:basic membrane protein A|nr:BMP family ABC transporter substrate-binding protein [Vallitalea sp.]
MMKKALSIIAMSTLVLTLLLTGCGEKDKQTDLAVDKDKGTNVEQDKDKETEEDKDKETNVEQDKDKETDLEKDKDKKSNFKVSMVTDTGGINDQSFNQSAWEGLQLAQTELKILPSFLESTQEADYGPNLEELYDQGNDLIWGIGYLMGDEVLNAAEINTDKKYAVIDRSFEEAPDNLIGVTFSEQEPSFLVGYIAGKMTKTNNVGFVGGEEFDVIWRFESGFRAGVKTANPDAEIQIQYANSFVDTPKGKAIANQMYQNGADIIFHAAGGTGTGVIESAVENGKYVIGVDKDQKAILGKDEIITSAVKRVDKAIYYVTKDFVDGKWEGGRNINYGLVDGAVGIAPTSSDAVPEDILKEVEQLEKDIIDGKIIIPKTREEYDELFGE